MFNGTFSALLLIHVQTTEPKGNFYLIRRKTARWLETERQSNLKREVEKAQKEGRERRRMKDVE